MKSILLVLSLLSAPAFADWTCEAICPDGKGSGALLHKTSYSPAVALQSMEQTCYLDVYPNFVERGGLFVLDSNKKGVAASIETACFDDVSKASKKWTCAAFCPNANGSGALLYRSSTDRTDALNSIEAECKVYTYREYVSRGGLFILDEKTQSKISASVTNACVVDDSVVSSEHEKSVQSIKPSSAPAPSKASDSPPKLGLMRKLFGEPAAGCGPFGCWKNGGGCNPFGCWNSPSGSCNPFGCSEIGRCGPNGCP